MKVWFHCCIQNGIQNGIPNCFQNGLHDLQPESEGCLKTRQNLVDAILEEDRLLRGRLNDCPAEWRSVRGPQGALSFKETLSHIAFWDNFTVDFFTHKLDLKSLSPGTVVDFEERSSLALEAAAKLPFGEVLARYLEATGALTQFLGQYWTELNPRQQSEFRVPLKHRRHHRISLFQALDEMCSEQGMVAEG